MSFGSGNKNGTDSALVLALLLTLALLSSLHSPREFPRAQFTVCPPLWGETEISKVQSQRSLGQRRLPWQKKTKIISLANLLDRLLRFVRFSRCSLYSVFVAVLYGMLNCVHPALERPLSHLPKHWEPYLSPLLITAPKMS